MYDADWLGLAKFKIWEILGAQTKHFTRFKFGEKKREVDRLLGF
jgi:hypothetical protein